MSSKFKINNRFSNSCVEYETRFTTYCFDVNKVQTLFYICKNEMMSNSQYIFRMFITLSIYNLSTYISIAHGKSVNQLISSNFGEEEVQLCKSHEKDFQHHEIAEMLLYESILPIKVILFLIETKRIADKEIDGLADDIVFEGVKTIFMTKNIETKQIQQEKQEKNNRELKYRDQEDVSIENSSDVDINFLKSTFLNDQKINRNIFSNLLDIQKHISNTEMSNIANGMNKTERHTENFISEKEKEKIDKELGQNENNDFIENKLTESKNEKQKSFQSEFSSMRNKIFGKINPSKLEISKKNKSENLMHEKIDQKFESTIHEQNEPGKKLGHYHKILKYPKEETFKNDGHFAFDSDFKQKNISSNFLNVREDVFKGSGKSNINNQGLINGKIENNLISDKKCDDVEKVLVTHSNKENTNISSRKKYNTFLTLEKNSQETSLEEKKNQDISCANNLLNLRKTRCSNKSKLKNCCSLDKEIIEDSLIHDTNEALDTNIISISEEKNTPNIHLLKKQLTYIDCKFQSILNFLKTEKNENENLVPEEKNKKLFFAKNKKEKDSQSITTKEIKIPNPTSNKKMELLDQDNYAKLSEMKSTKQNFWKNIFSKINVINIFSSSKKFEETLSHNPNLDRMRIKKSNILVQPGVVSKIGSFISYIFHNPKHQIANKQFVVLDEKDCRLDDILINLDTSIDKSEITTSDPISQKIFDPNIISTQSEILNLLHIFTNFSEKIDIKNKRLQQAIEKRNKLFEEDKSQQAKMMFIVYHQKIKILVEKLSNEELQSLLNIKSIHIKNDKYKRMLKILKRSIIETENLTKAIERERREFIREFSAKSIRSESNEILELKIAFNLGGAVFAPNVFLEIANNIVIYHKEEHIDKAISKILKPIESLQNLIRYRSNTEKKEEIIKFLLACLEKRNSKLYDEIDEAFKERSLFIDMYLKNEETSQDILKKEAALDKYQEEFIKDLIRGVKNTNDDFMSNFVVLQDNIINEYKKLLTTGSKVSQEKLKALFMKKPSDKKTN